MTDPGERQSSSGSAESPGVFTRLIKANDPMGLFTQSDCDFLGKVIEDSSMQLRSLPLETIPCANSDCSNPGGSPCDRCKLVSYCSQKCERKYRSVHRQICSPSGPTAFPDDDSRNDDQSLSNTPSPHEETTPVATLLSGNMPAVDLINLKNNERDGTRDFSLAFVASGDIRNVVRTVNALGSDFTGRLDILLSDTSDTVVSRNIVLLLILGAMPNEAVAADIALHFWYSVFLPNEYRLRILASLLLVLQQYTDRTESLSIPLGRRAKLTCLVPREITDRLLYTVGPTRSTREARDEYERVGAAPAQRDTKQRALAGLKPCHRLAMMAFWRSGVVLPFTVSSDHHTAPNASLFSPSNGTWLENHVENPLASWDPNEVVKAGRARGAQPEDIYGCLYFYLSDQLRTFAKRLRELDVTIHVFSMPGHALAQDISGGSYSRYGLMPSVRFDRIDLGHVPADSGVRNALTSWTPLLAEGDAGAIVCVFSDWIHVQKDGSVAGADESLAASIVGKLLKQGRLPHGTTVAEALATEMASLEAAYDNAKAFSRFLKTMSLRGTTVKRRMKHRILAHRVRMPIDAKTTDLPHMPDDETWYRYVGLLCVTVRLAGVSFTTRYVELARAGPGV